jgi:hypothetical protein
VSGDRLDDAIDGAVREIMGTEPPAGLRQRVIRRLAEPERRAWFAGPRLAFVTAVLLAVAIGAFAMLTMNRSRTTVPIEVAVAPQPSGPAPPAATSPGVAQNPPSPIAAAATRPLVVAVRERRAREQDERIVSATSLTEPDGVVVIAPLDPLRKIDPAPVESEVVQMDAIAIAPLQQMEPVRIEPLSSTPR